MNGLKSLQNFVFSFSLFFPWYTLCHNHKQLKEKMHLCINEKSREVYNNSNCIYVQTRNKEKFIMTPLDSASFPLFVNFTHQWNCFFFSLREWGRDTKIRGKLTCKEVDPRLQVLTCAIHKAWLLYPAPIHQSVAVFLSSAMK